MPVKQKYQTDALGLDSLVRRRLLDAIGQLRLLTLAPRQHDVGEELQQFAGGRRWGVGGLGGARLGGRQQGEGVGRFLRTRHHRYGDGAAVSGGGLLEDGGAAGGEDVTVLLGLGAAGARRRPRVASLRQINRWLNRYSVNQSAQRYLLLINNCCHVAHSSTEAQNCQN